MNNTKIYNRTTLNGTKWEIVYDGFIASLYMNGYFSGLTFRSVEDANAHLDRIDEKIQNPVVFAPCTNCSGYYGRGSNVYYGD